MKVPWVLSTQVTQNKIWSTAWKFWFCNTSVVLQHYRRPFVVIWKVGIQICACSSNKYIYTYTSQQQLWFFFPVEPCLHFMNRLFVIIFILAEEHLHFQISNLLESQNFLGDSESPLVRTCFGFKLKVTETHDSTQVNQCWLHLQEHLSTMFCPSKCLL